MKTKILILALLRGALFADDKTEPVKIGDMLATFPPRPAGASTLELKETPSYLFKVDPGSISSVWAAAMSPIYNRLVIGDWFDMRRKGTGQRIEVHSPFPSEEVTITVTKRPSVHENPDGTWTITF